MPATVTAYGIGKFIHVLAVIVAFGPTLAYPIFGAVARRAAPASVPAIIRGIRRANLILVNPGMLVVLAAGIYLVAEGSLDAGESWIGVGIGAIVVLIGMMHGFFMPRSRRALELAERDLAGGGALSPEFNALSRKIEAAGWLATLILVVAVFFMVVKP